MTVAYHAREYIEQFHLLLLNQLSQKLDKKLYALKGGCNLRFYFNSIRYSEDVDIDIHTIHQNTLHNKIERILRSRSFLQTLHVRDIEITHISASKQTNVTQRWKLLLKTPKASMPLHTKIEFSRRKKHMHEGTIFEQVHPTLTKHYHMMPILANHYVALNAYQQKIEALISRTATQARDIFDLYLLLQTSIPPDATSNKTPSQLLQAKENALSITFADFKSQILAYLTPDDQKQYDSQGIWDHILLTVVNALEPTRS